MEIDSTKSKLLPTTATQNLNHFFNKMPNPRRFYFTIGILLLLVVCVIATDKTPISANDQDALSSPSRINRDVLPTSSYSAIADHCIALLNNKNATDSPNMFPTDLFTLEEKRNGALILYIIGVLYMFIAMVVVCHEYFVPSLLAIGERLQISDSVVGAIFMAMGGGAPPLVAGIIGVFIGRNNNVAIGNVVGSATYNIFFVLAVCCFFSCEIMRLSKWPVLRDVSFYVISLILLILFFIDKQIVWFEALVLFIVYICYCIVMKFNEKLVKCVKTSTPATTLEMSAEVADDLEVNVDTPLDISWPTEWKMRLVYLILLPVVVPKWKNYYALTYFMSILWIGVFSYLMLWWTNVIGETLAIPAEIMGFTIPAVANADLIASVIVARRGSGNMLVSSRVGRNVFDVCVGMPVTLLLAFLRQAIIKSDKNLIIPVLSGGLICSMGMLFFMLSVWMMIIVLSKWRMHKLFGFVMIALYAVFCVISIMLETKTISCPLRLGTCADYV